MSSTSKRRRNAILSEIKDATAHASHASARTPDPSPPAKLNRRRIVVEHGTARYVPDPDQIPTPWQLIATFSPDHEEATSLAKELEGFLERTFHAATMKEKGPQGIQIFAKIPPETSVDEVRRRARIWRRGYQIEIANKRRGRGTQFVVTRRPIGMTGILERFDTRESAEAWIDAQPSARRARDA